MCERLARLSSYTCFVHPAAYINGCACVRYMLVESRKHHDVLFADDGAALIAWVWTLTLLSYHRESSDGKTPLYPIGPLGSDLIENYLNGTVVFSALQVCSHSSLHVHTLVFCLLSPSDVCFFSLLSSVVLFSHPFLFRLCSTCFLVPLSPGLTHSHTHYLLYLL